MKTGYKSARLTNLRRNHRTHAGASLPRERKRRWSAMCTLYYLGGMSWTYYSQRGITPYICRVGKNLTTKCYHFISTKRRTNS